MSLCDIAICLTNCPCITIWLLNCHYIAIWLPNCYKPTERHGESILHISDSAANPSVKTWLKQGTAVWASGSRVYKQHGASFPNLLFFFFFTRATLRSCCLATGYHPYYHSERSLWDELGIPKTHQAEVSDSLPRPGCLSFWGLCPFCLLRLWACCPALAGSVPSSTLVDTDAEGHSWPLWVSTPSALGLCRRLC